MRRRTFLGSLAAPVVAFPAPDPYGSSTVNKTTITAIGSQPLEKLRDFHKRELSEEYIKLWDKSGIDRQYGGFFPEANEEGDPAKVTDKEMYYQGRGLWVFSYIYNHFEHHPRHLETARMARNFLVKNCRDEKGYWISKFTRDGKRIQGSFTIYGDIYMVQGLAEYYKAAGNKEDLDLAIESAYGVMERIVSPSYQHLNGYGPSHEPGTKRLATWQHFLGALVPLLRCTQDQGVALIARMCVRNILERHWHPELGVAFELLDDRFEPFRPDPLQRNRIVSGWHSIQGAWMSMDEGLRLGNRKMFLDGLEMGRMTLQRCWVDGRQFSGLMGLESPEARPREPASIDGIASGALDDALVFCLMAMEHTHAAWAMNWYDKVFAAGYKYPDHWKRRCLLHHPRRLFLSIEILDRMIERGGKLSDFLDKA
jgi:N-acylglucosamine 2-epimerase